MALLRWQVSPSARATSSSSHWPRTTIRSQWDPRSAGPVDGAGKHISPARQGLSLHKRRPLFENPWVKLTFVSPVSSWKGICWRSEMLTLQPAYSYIRTVAFRHHSDWHLRNSINYITISLKNSPFFF
uniref:Uncharacterized protein n=1 Tax=Gopherus evgoodei TaxID=1825980 RepID=A0A8C4YQE8_9SAUR